MIDSENRAHAYEFFLEEVPELLQILETGLLNLQQSCNPGKIHDLMRAAHSLKGGAATVGLNAIKTIAHRLETIFKALSVENKIDTELETLLLKAYDCLQLPLNQQITTGSFDSELALSNADSTLTQIETRLGDALQAAENYVPSSDDLGIDIVSSLFEVDIAQGIDHIAKVIAEPQNFDLVAEIRTQAEVFSGFAEMLNLSGFGAISTATITALDANPSAALEIATLALDDFLNAKEQVLAGDRKSGGSPSETLLAFGQKERSPVEKTEHQAVASSNLSSLQMEAEVIFEPEELDFTDDPGLSSLVFVGSNSSLIPCESFLEEEDLVFTAEEEEAFFSEQETLVFSEEEEEAFFSEEEDLVFTAEEEEAFFSEQETATTDQEPLFSEQDTLVFSEEEEEPLFPEHHQQAQIVTEQDPETTSSTESEELETVNSSTQLNPAANFKIRVDSHRLDKINNFVGELVINRNSQALHQEQLQTILSKLQNRLEQFQRLTYQFQEISDRISIAPSHHNPHQTASLGDFDALEMDNYGKVYSLTQEIVEETMQFEEAVDDIVLYKRQSEDTLKQQQKTLSQLGEELMWARMMSLDQILGTFPRAIRDLSVKYQKPVNLNMSGTEVLVDKGILEKLHDPLLHLMRNAFDHGIELPEERLQQGKSEAGQIDICAYHQGNRTLIEIRDDGRGIEVENIARKAIDRGWLSVKQLAEINQDKLLDFIFEPGFSTTDKVSELSGRGVGLDVVRSQLEAIKGSVTLSSTPGEGTTFTLSLPLTQTISPMMVCSAHSSAVAIPAVNVREIILPQEEKINFSGNQRMLSWRDQLLPVYRLSDLLEYRYPSPIRFRSRTFGNVSSSQMSSLPLLVISQGEQQFALEVEGLNTEQELVIKPITVAIATPKYIYGYAVLGDGCLIPAIAPTTLLAFDRERKSANQDQHRSLAAQDTLKQQDSVPTALAVDDSAMMRRLLTRTLQKVGYRVLTAKDGWEALELLQQSTPVQLIVSDLEMPNLNGLELLNRLRQDAQLSQIPVAMLTSRSNDKHRSLAMTLGARTYLTKPYIEQEFLAELQKIIDIDEQNSPQAKGLLLSHRPLGVSVA
ncbi:hybrid sensor histidine kinase/response regulator [Pleurocapsa sp. PCC 7319]|uniref:hybrid sensor histidine kinase/response regulator n=1 Tax=Pleurocapsa sp. PCC 7319 TaxID=118161 RepID=UPI00034DBA06|nr:hybrid sensor histidine kinase/response regulator [Pleurocapsa sp. PCC 7319]